MPPALPIELTDAIINYLHADRGALAACTLVCRAWRRAAQHHLLATIVCARGGLERLIPQLEAKDSSSQVEAEDSVSQSFAAHVREMWIRGPERGLAVSLSVGTMERVLAALPNLHTLHLERVALVHSDALYARDPQIPQARRRYKLRRLDLRMVHQADTQRLTAMLALCAEVQELTLECVYSTGYGYSHDVEEAEGKTRCETLVVSGEDLVTLEVRRALRFDALKTCKVELPRSTHVRIVLGMLGAAASSLESLQLHLFSTYPASALEPLSAIPWDALTHLSLVLENRRSSEPLHIISVLSYFPPTIRSIELNLDASCCKIGTLRSLGLDDLEMHLLRFTRLRSFALGLHPGRPGVDEGFPYLVRKAMPTLAARGVLFNPGSLPSRTAQS